MGRTMINVGAIMDAAGQINSAKSSVNSAKSAFSQTKNSINSKIKDRSNIRSRLNTVQNQLTNIGSKIGQISATVQYGANLYLDTDKWVENWAEDIHNDKGAGSRTYVSSIYAAMFSNSDTVDEIKKKEATESCPQANGGNIKVEQTEDEQVVPASKKTSPWGAVGKFVGEMGFVGTAVSGLIDWTTGGGVGNAKAVADFAKSGKDVIKGLVEWKEASHNRKVYANFGKATEAKGKYWKSAFGLDDTFKGKASQFRAKWVKSKDAGGTLKALGQNFKTGTGTGWGTRFSRNFAKNLDSKVESYTKGGSTSAFAWVGLGLNLVGNGVSNYEEAKRGEISAGRAVAETITETVVDTATGWVVGAAVAAGVAATIGSAPVLLVGAATVGITMGLDYACKKITGAITGTEKGLTETISDVVLDVGEAVVKGAKKVVSGVANAAKNVGKKVSNFFGKLFG